MKKYPEIYESVLSPDIGPKDNAAIISDLLREICRTVGARYDGKLKEFYTGRSWRVRVESRDNDSREPYRVLDVGESQIAGKKICLHAGQDGAIAHRRIAYCESRITGGLNPAEELPAGSITQTFGTIWVYTSGDFGNYTAQYVAAIVARAYVEALERRLPDRFILVDQRALVLP